MDIYALIEKKQLKLAIFKLEDDSAYSKDENQYLVRLSPALYLQAANYATSKGIAIDTFVTKSVRASLIDQKQIC
ncbi:MAG: hypothetical protein K0R90_1697, partial [Oscillospiraceae bacterium]|nr:hypothetical protein [Oscillospiraceae bacterium]